MSLRKCLGGRCLVPQTSERVPRPVSCCGSAGRCARRSCSNARSACGAHAFELALAPTGPVDDRAMPGRHRSRPRSTRRASPHRGLQPPAARSRPTGRSGSEAAAARAANVSRVRSSAARSASSTASASARSASSKRPLQRRASPRSARTCGRCGASAGIKAKRSRSEGNACGDVPARGGGPSPPRQDDRRLAARARPVACRELRARSGSGAPAPGASRRSRRTPPSDLPGPPLEPLGEACMQVGPGLFGQTTCKRHRESRDGGTLRHSRSSKSE